MVKLTVLAAKNENFNFTSGKRPGAGTSERAHKMKDDDDDTNEDNHDGRGLPTRAPSTTYDWARIPGTLPH